MVHIISVYPTGKKRVTCLISDKITDIGDFVHRHEEPSERVFAGVHPRAQRVQEDDGWWMDPAGGMHPPDEDDPASMYK